MHRLQCCANHPPVVVRAFRIKGPMAGAASSNTVLGAHLEDEPEETDEAQLERQILEAWKKCNLLALGMVFPSHLERSSDVVTQMVAAFAATGAFLLSIS